MTHFDAHQPMMSGSAVQWRSHPLRDRLLCLLTAARYTSPMSSAAADDQTTLNSTIKILIQTQQTTHRPGEREGDQPQARQFVPPACHLWKFGLDTSQQLDDLQLLSRSSISLAHFFTKSPDIQICHLLML